MNWVALAEFNLTTDWQLSPTVDSRVFRLFHEFGGDRPEEAIAQITLAAVTPSGQPEVFKPQRIQPRRELEIVQFPLPPDGWSYSLAARLLVLPQQSSISWRISVEMPLYDMNEAPPPNPVGASSMTPTTVTVKTTPTKILIANPGRKRTAFYNLDGVKTVYLDMSSSITADTAFYTVAAKKMLVDDLQWTGEFYAVTKSGDVTLQVREFV